MSLFRLPHPVFFQDFEFFAYFLGFKLILKPLHFLPISFDFGRVFLQAEEILLFVDELFVDLLEFVDQLGEFPWRSCLDFLFEVVELLDGVEDGDAELVDGVVLLGRVDGFHFGVGVGFLALELVGEHRLL